MQSCAAGKFFSMMPTEKKTLNLSAMIWSMSNSGRSERWHCHITSRTISCREILESLLWHQRRSDRGMRRESLMGRRRSQRHWRQLRQCMLQFSRCYLEVKADRCCSHRSNFDGLGTHFVEEKRVNSRFARLQYLEESNYSIKANLLPDVLTSASVSARSPSDQGAGGCRR